MILRDADMNMRKQQSGAFLLEALIAILIFSMGILAIVGLQAASIKASGDAKYRSDASLLANQLIGQMWVSDRIPATLKTNFETDGDDYDTWADDVEATLPGVADNPPTVVIEPVVGPNDTSSMVTITVFWKAPSESTVHEYSVVTQII